MTRSRLGTQESPHSFEWHNRQITDCAATQSSSGLDCKHQDIDQGALPGQAPQGKAATTHRVLVILAVVRPSIHQIRTGLSVLPATAWLPIVVPHPIERKAIPPHGIISRRPVFKVLLAVCRVQQLSEHSGCRPVSPKGFRAVGYIGNIGGGLRCAPDSPEGCDPACATHEQLTELHKELCSSNPELNNRLVTG